MTTPNYNELLTAIDWLEQCEDTTDNASDIRKVIAWLEAKVQAQQAAEAETIALTKFAKEHGVTLSQVRKAWREHRRNG